MTSRLLATNAKIEPCFLPTCPDNADFGKIANVIFFLFHLNVTGGDMKAKPDERLFLSCNLAFLLMLMELKLSIILHRLQYKKSLLETIGNNRLNRYL